MIDFAINQKIVDNGYLLLETFTYHSPRYNKSVTCPANMPSDGATGAADIVSRSWWVHDRLCNTGEFDDGTPCTVYQASRILCDILVEEGRKVRAVGWFLPTLLFGGGECKANGWI